MAAKQTNMNVKFALDSIYNLLPRLIQRGELIREIAWDLDRQQNGTVSYFPLDFYEIHNFLFPFSEGSRDVDIVNYYFEYLNHPMILLPPTALEFIRYLERNAINLDKMVGSESTLIDDFLASPELQFFREKLETGEAAEIRSAYRQFPRKYRSLIDLLRTDAVRTRLEEPAQTFLRYLDEGRLVDLDQIADQEDWDFDEDVFTEALESFNVSRYQIEKRIPNRTDALNLAITFGLNNAYYKTANGGRFFTIVTHGGETRRVYSQIRWQNDPLPRNQKGTRLNKDHRYCAYRAYFEKFDDPQQELTGYLEVLGEIQIIQDQFEALYQRLGREYLQSLSSDSIEEVSDLSDIYKNLMDIEKNIKKVDLETKINPEPLSWDDENELAQLKEKLAGKNKIREALGDQIQAVGRAIKEVFTRLEPTLRSRAVEIVDRDGYKETVVLIESFDDTAKTLADSTGKKTPISKTRQAEEQITVRAYIKGIGNHQRPLELGRTYTLIVGLRWDTTKTKNVDVELNFDILVQAHDLKISTEQIEQLSLKPNSGFAWKEFEITPKGIGVQEIKVEVYHRRNNLCRIPLIFRVLGDTEPPYKDYYEGTTSGARSTPLPSSFQTNQVHMTINRLKGSSYELVIMCDGGPYRVEINLTREDISAHNRDIQQIAQRVAEEVSIEDTNVLSTNIRSAIRNLAREGKLLYNRLFNDEAKDILRTALKDGSIIEIYSDELLLPWDLIYDKDPNSADTTQFWGMRYIISRRPVANNRRIDPMIGIDSIPKIGLATDASLTAVEDMEIPFFTNLHRAGKIRLSRLDPLDAAAEDSILSFIEFLEKDFQVAHLACHARRREDNPTSACLIVSDYCEIQAKDLIIDGLKLDAHPLIILNACHTGIVDPLYTLDLVRTFLDSEALGIVATECEIPDTTAAFFAQKLYRYLLNEKPLGMSLVRTRWDLWFEANNPLGLFYGLYAPASTRFVKTTRYE